MDPDTDKNEPDTTRAAINQRIRKAQSQLPTVYGADRHNLKCQINRIRRLKPGPGYRTSIKNRLGHLEQKLNAAIKRRDWRRRHCPAAVYPDADLPILTKKDEIVTAIKENQVLIVSGETGSGKTTQIPKFCLDAGRGIDGVIGCTQPRRIAATTVARRIAEELGQSMGEAVGYKIRFRDQTISDGFIKIMTDGILLAEAQTDRFLNAYDTLIIDEAHERSLNIDLTLGIIKRILSRRQDLKLIVTSATIDTRKFSRAFDEAPIIEVSGRMYPVQVHYDAPAPSTDGMDSSPVDMAVKAVGRIAKKNRQGDILVFMPTEQDIRDTCRILDGRYDQHTTVFPLFARLAGPTQAKVFSKVPGRKIIVATNVAETSITIPGIKYVVDTGLARIPRYTPRSRCTLLPIDPISRSSADQRKGRCGRVSDGVCVRLYSEEDYLARPLFTPPEILRSNLADVILRMIALNLGDINDFPFIDPPPPRMIQDGLGLLLELNAITPINHQSKKVSQGYRLTTDGKVMARLPIDPRLSRMLIEARRRGCVAEVTIIASALSIQDPRVRPPEAQKEADRVHAAWSDPASDFVSLLNFWRWYDVELASGKGIRKMRRRCRDHFLSYRRMREWKDIHRQLCTVLKESKIPVGVLPVAERPVNKEKSNFSSRYIAVHQSILSGFLSNIACKKEKNIYTAANGREVMVFPGSGLFNQAGKWIVAAEMVQTSQLFARIVANIDPGWLEPLAGDRCRYTYSNPHWDSKKETVMGIVQVSLFGLVIVSRRSVVYGRIDEKKACEVFIDDALVEGDFRMPIPFVTYNQRQVESVRDMENRFRRRDLYIGDQALVGFYRKRLDGIWNVQMLSQEIKKHGNDSFLRVKKDDLFRYQRETSESADFPDSIRLGTGTYPATYAYEPGGPTDGVTVRIPAGAVTSVPIGALDWLVPGLLLEKIKTLIKGLPKTVRRQLGPLPQVVDVIADAMPLSGETQPLINILGPFLHRRFGVHIPASKWPVDSLPDYLKMRIVVTDAGGREIQSSRNPDILHRFSASDGDSGMFTDQKKRWEKSGITRWEFDEVPDTVELSGTDKSIRMAYPGLTVETDKPGQVCLRLYPSREQAVEMHLSGVRMLAMLHLAKELRFLKKALTLPGKTASKISYFGNAAKVEQQLFEKVTTILFAKNIRTRKAFTECLNKATPTLHQTGQTLMSLVKPVLSAVSDTWTQLKKWQTRHLSNHPIHHFIDQRLSSLAQLIPIDFITLYDMDRLDNLPLYIRAISVRTQRAIVDLEKDRRKTEQIQAFSEHLGDFLSSLSSTTSDEKRQAIEAYFWMLETFKVSIFAQELKTPRPVSAKRLKEQVAEIERMT